MTRPWARLGIGRTTFIAVAVILLAFGSFAIVEARLLTASTPATMTDRPDSDPVVMSLDRPAARIQQQWAFSVGPGDRGTYDVDTWTEYRIVAQEAGGSGELHGTFVWRTEARELTRVDHTHTLAARRTGELTVQSRFGPVEADQILQHVVSGDERTMVTVDVYWNLTIHQPGDSTVSVQALDGRYALHSPDGIVCDQLRCAVTVGVAGVLIALVPVVLAWGLRDRPPPPE